MLPLLLVSAFASAQVYESVDEQGNPAFSDQPSADSQPVDIPEPNLGDAVKAPPTVEAVPEVRPEIAADREASDVDGEMIGEQRKKKKRRGHVPPRPSPK